MRFDLVDMKLFLAVVEHGSLTRAAQAVNLALASVSERVSGMEDALGAPLVQRTRRGVRPTAAGDAFARHARVISNQLEQMQGELRTYGAGLRGRIRLLSNTAALASFLPPQLCSFLVAHPELSIDLEERPSADIALAIAEGRAELGVVADSADLAALQTYLIATDQLVVITAKSHRIAQQASVSFAEIVTDPFVGVSDAALEIHLQERASRLGRQIQYRVQIRNVEQVGELVAAAVGIAILPQVMAAQLEQRGLVASVPLSEAWTTRQLKLCARDFAALTPAARLLADQLMALKTTR
jgi:DNA-binding transcriptional LysR family regulator